jgi:hypothetical protein
MAIVLVDGLSWALLMTGALSAKPANPKAATATRENNLWNIGTSPLTA